MSLNAQGYFISPAGGEALKNFQYNGADNSLIYGYILKPLANFLVRTCVPRTIAPNSITLFGLFWMITSYTVMSFFCPNLDDVKTSESTVPSWIFLLNGVAILVYQTLDNMDGVQARTTGSSSPLGLLFDHGCDAFNVVLGTTNLMCVFGVGSDSNDLWIMAVMLFCPPLMFYITTWEEYYTGKLDLPIVNGPTEGLLLFAGFSFATGILGVKYWYDTNFYEQLSPYILPILPILPNSITTLIPETGLKNIEILLSLMILGSIQEGFLKIGSVVRKYGLHTVSSLIPLLSLCVLTLVIGATIPNFVIRNPRLFLNLFSSIFVEMVTALMLDHMTLSDFKPFRWALLPMVILAVYGSEMGESAQDSFLYSYAFGMFVYLGFKIRIIIHEICCTLGIWCFDIVNPYVPAVTGNGLQNGHAKSH